MSVKVGVRVRPFNQREKDLNCRLCVDMMGATTRLFDINDNQKYRDFTFDYSFWSHDQYHENQTGYFMADGDKYADQQQVFQMVGLEILTNAWEGYHCCLFAYGQTGAGKSYSMVGYGSNKILKKGIVPISCQQIFNRIQRNENELKQYQVNVSMLQIYNEKVQDLLIPISKRLKQGFKIRQHKTLGIYVQGLSKHYVDTYKSIESKMEQGNKNRSIASTEMNANSSRAHTIISIQFKQRQTIAGAKRQKLSVIHLVDLAGSQKVGKTGATGDRLKQATGINKSLTVLGLVISSLADKAMGRGKGVVVPYRDSCLTRILQNALGGNSKTLMICAISPATDNYQETLSTLRYADQAKKIQNKATVNQSQNDKRFRALTSQNELLKQKIMQFEQTFKKLKIDQLKLEQFNDMKQQIRVNTMMINDITMTKKQKLNYQKNEKMSDICSIDLNQPHLSNLHQDPILSGKTNYAIDKQIIKIGKRNSQPHNDIEIGGTGIRNLHATITRNQNQKIYIQPAVLGDDSGCYLNGGVLTTKTELMHYDRLTFATNNMFIVKIPGTEERDKDLDVKMIDCQFAQNELYLGKQLEMQLKEKQIKEQNELKLRKKEQELERLQLKLIEQQKQKVESEKKKNQQQEAQRLKLQIQKDRKKMKHSQSIEFQRKKQRYNFQKQLLKAFPKCIQLNLIAKQFKRNITMDVKILPNNDEQQQIQLKKRNIKIKVTNKQVGYCYQWDVQQLQNRYYLIKDMSQNYFNTSIIPKQVQKDDPFWDPPKHSLLGLTFHTTKFMSYLFDHFATLSIIGQQDYCGQIIINLIPTDSTGQRNLCQQLGQQQQFYPQQLIGKPFYYNVVILSAKIPDNHKNIYVQYSVKVDENKSQTFRTQQIVQRTKNPIWNYKKLHKFQKITQSLLNYLTTSKIIFKVYAYDLVSQQKKKLMQPPQIQIKQLNANNQSTTQQSNGGCQGSKIKSYDEALITQNQHKDKQIQGGISLQKKQSTEKKNLKEKCVIF